MAIQSSGAITLLNVQNEFGGSTPISLSEYYRTPYGAYVTSNNTSVPTTGAISLSNFYGATNQFTFHISSNTKNANIRTLALNAGWDGSAPVVANVLSGIYLWSDSTSTGGAIIAGSFPAGLTFNNYGKIIGRGGNAGQNGGPALTVASSGVAVLNKSGAYIAGGGGGGGSSYSGGDGTSSNTDSINGGGGAGGGSGAGYAAGSGGAIGQAGSNAGATSSRDEGPGAYATGGGSGGGSGGNISRNSGTTQAGGGGGGRILPGVGGTKSQHGSGNGGSAGAVGGSAGGGGGWGASGGAPGYSGGYGGSSTPAGSGGAAISGTSVSLTNSGTIYGST